MSSATKPGAFDAEVGARLRGARDHLGLSLADVEAKSGGKHKASVLGAYERGERQLLLKRLYELAEFYGVDLFDLLPPREPPKDLRGQLDEVEHRAYLLWQEIAATRAWFPGIPPHPDGEPS